MDDRNSYLEGEDEYLDVQDDQSDCGTQLDDDETSQRHESYNFTQVDENVYHPDPLLAEEKEDPVDYCSDHDGRFKIILLQYRPKPRLTWMSDQYY